MKKITMTQVRIKQDESLFKKGGTLHHHPQKAVKELMKEHPKAELSQPVKNLLQGG